ncbi:Eco57I restriction-modification methylase domain-containing protein [Variovorax sp.]|uniref:Eco57I restriction-modification methylase domain-containing protein n=1 Tax=Variovorax sp. TaxID=1871043 RepID=UPI003BAB3EC0
MARDPAKIQFDTLAIEGGLFTAEWLGKVASFTAPAQAESDYHVRAGFTLREEIALAWRSAQALWAQFDNARRLADQDAAAVTQRFVTEFLRQVLGFTLRQAGQPVEVDGRAFPIGHFAFGDTVPVVSGIHTLALDAADVRFGNPAGTRRRSAFGLLQEYLNAQNTALWGAASNGLVLRLARDNASLTRPAWVEADLERLFTEERFAEFGVLWLLLHATRFGGENVAPSESVLERWRNSCRDQGVRARDVLRDGVEQALLTLGNGFLSHPGNAALREALACNRLDTREFFQQLLRLVYRQIFLLTIEERGILHPESSDAEARELYAEGYSLRRLRDRAVRRNAHDRHYDLWEGLKLVWKGLVAGEVHLALPALSGLFAPDQCRDLDASRLENRHLLLALFHLAWLRDNHQLNTPLTRVNWRDMGPEELGSIYESLLELVPQADDGNRRFAFLQGAETRGNARKTTGSYYTPDSLVQLLLDSALEPVISDKLAGHPSGQTAIDALLSLTVVDPACGSGHFLLAAARRIATHLARVMAESSGGGQPTPADYRHALRQVVGRCIFGVDLNPMAVELCKVSLWLEAVDPGLPLTFLDSHIQRGNALLGTKPELMTGGVPNEAWEPIEGDDRKVASALKRRNAAAAGGQRSMEAIWSTPVQQEVQAVANALAALDATSDLSPEALATKESRWSSILGSADYRHQRFIADAWSAAFVWPKQSGPLAEAAPTNDLWRHLHDGQGQAPVLTATTVADLATQFGLFHWHLQFPQVFANGGFDVVLGNPPWEQVVLNDEEWFAERNPTIAAAPTSAARRALIAALGPEDARLVNDFRQATRTVQGETAFVRKSGAFPLTGKGRINTYSLFHERAEQLVSPTGFVGLVLQTGALTDFSQAGVTSELVRSGRLAAAFDFENGAKEGGGRWFRAVHPQTRFVLIAFAGRAKTVERVRFAAGCVSETDARGRSIDVPRSFVERVSPNTGTVVLLQSEREVTIVERMLDNGEFLGLDGGGPSLSIAFAQPFNSSSDSGLFRTAEKLGIPNAGPLEVIRNEEGEWWPLLEAKYGDQFNHRYGSFEGTSLATRERKNAGAPVVDEVQLENPSTVSVPRYWVARGEVAQGDLLGRSSWQLLYRFSTYPENERTMIAWLSPGFPSTEITPRIILPRHADSHQYARSNAYLVGALNSFAYDFFVRRRMSRQGLSFFIVKQTVVPDCGKGRFLGDVQDWVACRVLELSYTAWSLEAFALDLGYGGPPFRWSNDRRFALRCEMDSAFFHLYGLARSDVEYVLDSFDVLRRSDERAHGSFRTKQVILDIYDEMAEAVRTGKVYTTRLDPPPADIRIAHGPRVPEVPAVPSVAPTMPPAEEAAILILALVHANGGTIRRTELARAFSLRSMPSVLLKLVPTLLSDKAKHWAAKRPAQALPGGQMAAALEALSSRSGVTLGIDAASRAVVETNPTTPAESKIDEWFRFEARLLLNVLRSQPDEALKTIDTGLKGNDRTLLDEAA